MTNKLDKKNVPDQLDLVYISTIQVVTIVIQLEGFGIRLNKDPPNINFKKKEKGGINLQTLVPQSELDLDLVKTILSEYRIHNADITLRYDATADDLIDVVEGNRSYIPCIYLLNKIDQVLFFKNI